jgi:hypothetical protein
MNLRGEVIVRARDPTDTQTMPGRRIDLEIGNRSVSVPADPEVPPRSPDFAPVGLVLGACLFARLAAPTAERVPVRIVLPLMASTITAACIAERQLRRHGSAAQGEVQLMALAVSAAATVLATRNAQRPFKPSGGQNFPFYATLTVPMLGYAFQHQELSHRMRWISPAGFLAIAASGWLLAPRPRQFGQFLLSLSWPLSGLVSSLRVSREFRADVCRLAHKLRSREQAAVDAAFNRGAASVIRLARAAYADAAAQLEQHQDQLDPELVRAAAQRLQEVHRCLNHLEVDGE